MATERTNTGISKKKSTSSRIKVPACTSCHSRKIKCNKTRPCLNCVRYGVSCTSADLDEEEYSPPSTGVGSGFESSDLQALKDRIAHLESLLTKTTQGNMNGNAISATPSLGPDTPQSTSSRSEPATPSTYSNDGRDKNTGSRKGSGFGVWEINMAPQHINTCAGLMKDELPNVKFFPKKDAMEYLAAHMRAVFLRKRYAYVDELVETFNQVYPPQMGATEVPTVPATATTLSLYCALLLGMYPDSFKSFSAYLVVKPALRLLWSQLSLQVLDMILMEAIFLTSSGRLDEGYLCAGSATRVAQALGLHVSSSMAFQGLDELGIEKAKMLWWEVYCYDRWYALATGRPLAIRDKDCNISMPNFTFRPKCVETPFWQPDFWVAKIRLAQISGKITSKLQKPTQKDLPSFYATSCRNPFRPPPEHIGAKLNDELNQLAKDLPPSLQNPIAHPPALYLALKFQSTKMMLFRSFLHHQDVTMRQQAQEEVFAAALTVTRLCYEGRESIMQITCGTISMILLTCAVALASYSRAHQGKESVRAMEAKEAFETLRTSLKCLDRENPQGPINSLHMKNGDAIKKLQAFLDPSSVTPNAPTPNNDNSTNHSSLANTMFSPSTTTAMQMDTSFDNGNINTAISPTGLNAMLPPQNPGTNGYPDGKTSFNSQNYYMPQQAINQMNNDFNFYNLDNYNPELEFGHVVDPFSEAFFAELMNTNETNMTPEDWSRLLA